MPGDPLSIARAMLDQRPDAPLLVYLTDEAFAGTRGHVEGMTRAEHRLHVERIAAQLANEGRHVSIREVR